MQLWEEDGIDLALIPYGCIATGPDSGFIEVVKNARTIAEVRRVWEGRERWYIIIIIIFPYLVGYRFLG